VLVDRIIQRALDCLHEAWMLVKDINFAVAQSESNPAMVQIVPPNEVVVAVGFEIGMGGRSGMMSFCIPYNVIEPIMSEFTGHDWAAYGRGGAVESSRKVVVSRISTSLVNVTAYLAETSISLNDLMALKPGDILRTDKASDGELLITVNRQAKFRGKPGLFKGHKAVELTRFALPQEPV
jgi:flagellar motor switch protein FliM